MSYLIDTDIVIYSLKGNETVNHHFKKNKNAPKSISVITYGELLFGAKKSQNHEKNLAIVYRIKEIFPIIQIDKPIIEIFSTLKAGLQKDGKPLDDFDLLIAATALTSHLTLVTNNEKHFQRINGLKIENWAKP